MPHGVCGAKRRWKLAWSTGSIATVTSSGLVTGVSPGSTYTSVVIDNAYVGAGYLCEGQFFSCPTGNFQAQAPTTVLKLSDVVPDPLVVGTSGPMGLAGTGFSTVPGPVTVNVSGSGVTVTSATVASGSDTQITATYTVASGTAIGERSLTVSFGSGEGVVTSNSLPITRFVDGAGSLAGRDRFKQ